MCGRYSETIDPMELAAVLSIELCTYEFNPRPMIAPTQMAPVILRDNGRTELRSMRWGLIPHWADDEKIGTKMINARSETAAQKPAFREAWQSRRCLIPATGFYEWKRSTDPEGRGQAYHFTNPTRPLICFAGLWERWHRPPAKQTELFENTFEPPPSILETFTLLTTEPNEVVKSYHDRMPVILGEGAGEWLNGDEILIEETEPLKARPM
jgi:putative SOS response-associated peptidase YedK